MDLAPLLLLVVALALVGWLWWSGRSEWVVAGLALLGALLAWVVLRPREPWRPTPVQPRGDEERRQGSAGRRIEEAREERAPTTNADADARAAADRLNRRRR